jgi:hypothetical protein
MSNQLVAESKATAIETAVIIGDLSKLSPEQRVSHYLAVCKSTGLNPLTKPFDYLQLSGKLILYARKDSTDQLRNLHSVSITKLEREIINDVYTVTAYAKAGDGREDSSIGAVNIKGVTGDALANAMMKAETKAKRRVTLSICGLGWLDETEIETIPNARPVLVTEHGEIVENDNASAMTLEQAREVKTPKGTPLEMLDRDQIQEVVNKARLGTELQRAASIVLASWDPTPATAGADIAP